MSTPADPSGPAGASEPTAGPAGASGATPDLGDLMHVAFRRLRRGWTEQLAPFDLTPYQFRALQAVGRGPAWGGHGSHGAHDAGVLEAGANDAGALDAGVLEAEAGDRAVDAHHGCEVCEAASEEGMRLKDLAERLRIAPRSATEVVDQLQAKGLVGRQPDPADRRATRIVLTEEGARARARIREERRRQAGDFFSVLSAPDRAELARLLAELVRSHP